MATFFVVNIQIPNQSERSGYDEYIAQVKPIVESYGGKYVARSEQITQISGEIKLDRIIVIEFEDRQQLVTCFASPEYTSVKGLREMCVISNAYIVEQ